MGDKEAIKLLQEKLRKTLRFQDRVKEVAELAATEKEEQERQER